MDESPERSAAKTAMQEFAMKLSGELKRMDNDDARLAWSVRRLAEYRARLIIGGLTVREANVITAGVSAMVRAMDLGEEKTAVH